MKKTTQFKKMIQSKELEFILEAHNGITAKIVEEAGFKGIWGSGLTLSASLGVRDNNEASWTQVLEILEFMSDATTIPILLDGDTGYGNFNNMRRLVKKLEQREIAGVCIEDKLFPKTNSFINSEQQPLAEIDEFCGKIKAGKDSQCDPDFCVVARVEAFIAGWGVEEALKRAEAYRKAGADAILVHSKKNNPSDIEAFMKEWANRHPVVIVPTKYYSTPTGRFRELGISLVIWANHLMRGAIRTMQGISQNIYDNQSLLEVEDKIVTVSEVFRLQGADELKDAEKKYLPTKGKDISCIILAASRGSQLGDMTKDKPKAMITINKKPMLTSFVELLKGIEIKKIVVVRGYKKETISGDNLTAVDNDDFETTKDLYSLYLAKDHIKNNCIIAYGDCLYRKHLIHDLLDNANDIKIVVDADLNEKKTEPQDLVRCSKPYSNDFFNKDIFVEEILTEKDWKNASGEWAGLVAVKDKGVDQLRQALDKLSRRPDFKKLSVTDLLRELALQNKIAVVYTKGGWIDIDNIEDYSEAEGF